MFGFKTRNVGVTLALAVVVLRFGCMFGCKTGIVSVSHLHPLGLWCKKRCIGLTLAHTSIALGYGSMVGGKTGVV